MRISNIIIINILMQFDKNHFRFYKQQQKSEFSIQHKNIWRA